jgi:hypothetical protein
MRNLYLDRRNWQKDIVIKMLLALDSFPVGLSAGAGAPA